MFTKCLYTCIRFVIIKRSRCSVQWDSLSECSLYHFITHLSCRFDVAKAGIGIHGNMQLSKFFFFFFFFFFIGTQTPNFYGGARVGLP